MMDIACLYILGPKGDVFLYLPDERRQSMDTNLLQHMKRARDWRIIFPVFLVSIIACIDRVNIAYAKLTMTQDLTWITPEVFGMGAGIFFVGYLIFEIPGSLVAAHFSATKWIARIMFTWGLVSIFMAFVSTEFEFYLCRGFSISGYLFGPLPPVVYRSRTVSGNKPHADIPPLIQHSRGSDCGGPPRIILLWSAWLARTLYLRSSASPYICSYLFLCC